jgi:hypothetical protein
MHPFSIRLCLIAWWSLALVAVVPQARGIAVQDYAVRLTAAVSASPGGITLSWAADSDATAYNVYRRPQPWLVEDWGLPLNAGALPGGATSFLDTTAVPGTLYEYRVVKNANEAGTSYTGYGFISSGIEVPLVDARGTVVLIVEATHAAFLAVELARLVRDLVGDGWKVIRHDVQRTASVASVKTLIKAAYDADPAGVKSVFLFGRVPVPYSGNIAPDGHTPDHLGAWPADLFYGDMNGVWTDTTVNNTGASRAENDNIPGDGKYDQSSVPVAGGAARVELQVGRVDLANMPAFAPKAERDLLRQYLDKDHAWRHRQLTAPVRGLIDDSFGTFNGEAFAVNGWRNFRPLTGTSNTFSLDWVTTLRTDAYLWAYGCGAGSYTSASGVATTADFAANDLRAVFTMIFGSYHGDWDSQNNLLRAPLAGATHGLACAWAGRPHWYFHAMGMGETLGFCAQQTQSNGGVSYPTNSGARGVHVALMGDPTLRLHMVAPPSNVVGVANGSGGLTLTWSASPDAVAGYHVYIADAPAGPFTRLTSQPVAGTSFSHGSNPTNKTCMVRAVRLETTPSGSYYNASQGVFDTVGELTCAITSPSTGSAQPVAGFLIQAAAADEDSTIAKVEFFHGSTRLGEDVAAPYEFFWANPPPGNQSFFARATNAIGETVDSAPVSVLVGAYTPPAPIDFNAVYVAPDPEQDATAGTPSLAQVLDGGATLRLNGNCWKRVQLSAPYTVTANTLLQFDFQTSAQAEYHGIALDEDNSTANATRVFQLYGTQTSGIQTYRNYPGGGVWKTYTIAVSQHYTGAMNYVVFTNDHDAATSTASSHGAYRNVRIFEGPVVSISATDAAASELGLDGGVFTVSRTGPTSAPLTVQLSFTGTAAGGTDYTALPASVTIPAGSASATVAVTPIADSLAEGPETVIATLAPDPAYGITNASASATVTIADVPFDQWRFDHFTASERANPAVSGPLADPDSDGVVNLLENYLRLAPKTPDRAGLPQVTLTTDHLRISFRRARGASDLSGVVEVTGNLAAPAWDSGDAFTEVVSITDLGDGTEQVIVRDKTSIGPANPARFIRLRVSR